jgi:PAS domain S-box-containing protein
VSSTKVPLRDATGNFTGLVGISRDITGHMQAEEALRLAHERLRRFVDSNIIGIVIATAEGAIIEANDYYLRVLGHTREELTQGKINWRSVTPPEWLPVSDQAFQELRERGTCAPYEKEYLRPDGTRVPVFLADTLLPGPREEIAAFVIDLTERKRTEEALRQQSEDIRVRNERLTRFNATAVGRELRMLELKREVNELCARLGEPPRHRVTGNESAKQAELELPG